MPTSSNFCDIKKNRKYKRQQSANHNSDYSNIDPTEQVRDLGVMMSNTSTHTLHIRNTGKISRDKMRLVLSASVDVALSRTDILKDSCHSPTRVLLPPVESMEGK